MIRIFGLIFLAMFPHPDDSFTPAWTKKESLQGKQPWAEYYFLCEDILYSMCIHKKKAMKAGQGIM